MDCIFCKIANKEIPSKIIAETNRSVAFLYSFPLTKAHSLVIPQNHHEKIQDMSSDENSDLFETVHKVISKVDSITNATLIAVHNGKASGQEIAHVHVHLIPRSSEDLAGPVHSMFTQRPKFSENELNEIHAKLKE